MRETHNAYINTYRCKYLHAHRCLWKGTFESNGIGLLESEGHGIVGSQTGREIMCVSFGNFDFCIKEMHFPFQK